ncbi:MAG: family 1 glycosylhydrolase [Abditibacteriota bacterium]|nr:family 1 glycosylhydrolase [Abditibacteriota bacterium]
MKIEFPKDFLWGVATSSCQIEGSANIDGKVDSVWDTYADAGKCLKGDTPRVACDHYHRYKEDVALMKELGVKVYRFSICWPRVISDIKGTVNEKGLEFYSNLVDELIAAGIEPWITLFHWDLPQYLQDAFGGFLSRDIVGYFQYYTEVMVKALGDRVKHWMPINEPDNATTFSYGFPWMPPGPVVGEKKTANSIHHINLCHGIAVKTIKELCPDAKVGCAFDCAAYYPREDCDDNWALIEQEWKYENGYFLDPMFFGKYPDCSFRNWHDGYPDIEHGDMELLNHPIDFLGINQYYGYVLKIDGRGHNGYNFYVREHNDLPNSCMGITPDMFYYLLKYLHRHYPIKELYVTENGNAWTTDTEEEQLKDDYRIDFIKMHLSSVRKAMDEGYFVNGYFHWSFIDNFEWGSGYKWKFGLVHLGEDLKREPKKSFWWYKDLIKNNSFEKDREYSNNENPQLIFWNKK